MSLPRCIIPGRVYMVTRRCTQRQFLMRPDAETKNAFVYCLALAARRANIQVVAFLGHSNHHHTIVVDTDGRMPEFLETLHKLFAKHQNALRGRWENFWASEPTSVVELIDPEDILSKVTYALSNPVKDHLVEHADQWPGASSLAANLKGQELSAVRPRHFFKQGGGQPESLTLTCERPPAFKSIRDDEWRALLAERIRAAEEAAASERRARGIRVLGRREVLRQNPNGRPSSKEPRGDLSPRVAGVNKWRRIEALQRNKTFLAAYRAARDLWQSGFDAVFPVGTYWLRLFAGVPVTVESS